MNLDGIESRLFRVLSRLREVFDYLVYLVCSKGVHHTLHARIGQGTWTHMPFIRDTSRMEQLRGNASACVVYASRKLPIGCNLLFAPDAGDL